MPLRPIQTRHLGRSRRTGGLQMLSSAAPVVAEPEPTPELSQPFAADSWRYTPIPDADYTSLSSTDAGVELGGQLAMGGSGFAIADFSNPVYVVGPDAPTQAVGWWESQVPGGRTKNDPGVMALLERMSEVPVPQEMEAAGGTDMSCVIYQPSTDTMWELWRLRRNEDVIYQPMDEGQVSYEDWDRNVLGDEWQITWGGRIDNVSQNYSTSFFIDEDPLANGAMHRHGVTASGISTMAGTITVHELRQGLIPKAVNLAVWDAAKTTTTLAGDGISWPATRTDGSLPNNAPTPYGGAVPLYEGQRLVMDRSVSIAGKHPLAATLITALQTYGAVIIDRAGSVSPAMESPRKWTDKGLPDPYVELLDGAERWQIASQIPWDQMRAMPLHYGKPEPVADIEPLPSGVTVLNRWKAASIDSLADGEPVPIWQEGSGSGVNLAQEEAAKQPTYRTNVLNGKPVVRFDGIDDGLKTLVFAPDAQPMTLYFTFKADPLTGGPGTRFLMFGAPLGAYIRASNGQRCVNAGTEATFQSYTVGTWEVWSVVVSGGTASLYANGTLRGAAASAVGAGGLGSLFTIGHHPHINAPFAGDIAEVIHCDGAHDATQRGIVHDYLEAEYGIPIA